MSTPLVEKQSGFDPKKRALEALERRFAFAKAESEERNSKIKTRKGHEEGEEGVKGASGDGDTETPSGPTSTPSRKGNFVFCGSALPKSPHTASGRDQPYLALSNTFDENLINTSEKLSNNGASAMHRVVHDLLQNGESSQKYMQGARNMKIDNWFLLDSFVRNEFSSANAHIQAMQKHSKRSKRHVSMKQHKKLGSFNLSPEFHRYELFQPMHELWNDYITKLLKDSGQNQMPQRLLAADLHGAILLVVQCKQAAFIGINGIMIRETAETLGIITESNKFQVVPKRGSVFIFQAGTFKITLIGDKLIQRDGGVR